jgi:hypothetical protein
MSNEVPDDISASREVEKELERLSARVTEAAMVFAGSDTTFNAGDPIPFTRVGITPLDGSWNLDSTDHVDWVVPGPDEFSCRLDPGVYLGILSYADVITNDPPAQLAVQLFLGNNIGYWVLKTDGLEGSEVDGLSIYSSNAQNVVPQILVVPNDLPGDGRAEFTAYADGADHIAGQIELHLVRLGGSN